MRTMLAVVLVMMSVSLSPTAQVTRREVTNPTTPADDAKPLSDIFITDPRRQQTS